MLDENGNVEGHALLAFRGQDMAEPIETMAAIGSGGDIALGAMAALARDPEGYEEALHRAIELACDLHGECDYPVRIACT